MLRSRYSLAYIQAQNIHDNKPPGRADLDSTVHIEESIEEDEIGRVSGDNEIHNTTSDSKNLEETKDSLYKATGSPVDPKDIPWLKHDIDLLMKSILLADLIIMQFLVLFVDEEERMELLNLQRKKYDDSILLL